MRSDRNHAQLWKLANAATLTRVDCKGRSLTTPNVLCLAGNQLSIAGSVNAMEIVGHNTNGKIFSVLVSENRYLVGG